MRTENRRSAVTKKMPALPIVPSELKCAVHARVGGRTAIFGATDALTASLM